MKSRSILFVLLAAGLGLSLLTGCDNLTRNRFDMITVQVDKMSDVERMIGEPTNKMPKQWHYQRMDKHLEVFVDFDDGSVVIRKQWIDALSGEWWDSQTQGDVPYTESTAIRKTD